LKLWMKLLKSLKTKKSYNQKWHSLSKHGSILL
jgi:hypothetical protein